MDNSQPFFAAMPSLMDLPNELFCPVIGIPGEHIPRYDNVCLRGQYIKNEVELFSENLHHVWGFYNEQDTHRLRIIDVKYNDPREAIAFAKSEWEKVFGPLETEQEQHEIPSDAYDNPF